MMKFRVLLSLAFVVYESAAYPFGSHYPLPEGQVSQTFTDNFNPVKNFGGNGPYSDGRGFGISRDPPEGCSVDQVIMLHRHGERYPDVGVYQTIEKAINKLTAFEANNTLEGDLDFFSEWDFWIHNSALIAQETTTGPYAGLLDGYSQGTEYAARYKNLWDGKTKVPMFSSGYQRIIETARKFGEGFFGRNYSEIVDMNIIPEDAAQGANSLTPSCHALKTSNVCGNLTHIMPEFSVAAERLNKQNPGLTLNSTDVYALMITAAYELNANPYSPWIDVFTREEWISFGYTQDLIYYYCDGPGDAASVAAGSLYANATLTLMNQGPEKAGKLYFSFCHDVNITPVLAAIGLFTPKEDLPVDRLPFTYDYHSGDFVPMGGHLVFERMTCNQTANNEKGVYVRAVVNEAVIPFEECSSGPEFSCSLSNYTTYLNSKLKDFNAVCKTPSSYPQELTFFWNYNDTNQYDYQNGPVSYQLGLTNE